MERCTDNSHWFAVGQADKVLGKDLVSAVMCLESECLLEQVGLLVKRHSGQFQGSIRARDI